MSWINLLWFVPAMITESLVNIMSYTFTLTLNMNTILIILCLLAVAVFYVVRYYLLARYSRLPASKSKMHVSPIAPSFDLRPEAAAEAQERPFLPEEIYANFLQSIRLLNHLDKHILRELAKDALQMRMRQGELLWRSDRLSRDLYLVMKGTMQVFLAIQGDRVDEKAPAEGLDADMSASPILLDGFKEAHLLCEVTSGGSVSSNFDLLSIYTEDVKLEDTVIDLADVDSDMNDSKAEVNKHGNEDTLTSGTQSPALVTPLFVGGPALPTPSFHSASANKSRQSMASAAKANIHSGQIIVARASSDVSLLVLPEESFRKLARRHPAAATQVVQYILTRFQRVTFLTLYKYLGLTNELLKIEQAVNGFSGIGLPENFVMHGKDLERLRDLPKKRIEPSQRNSSSESLNAVPATTFDESKKSYTNELGPFVVTKNSSIAPSKVTSPIVHDHHRGGSFTPEMLKRISRNSDKLEEENDEIRALIFECLAHTIGLPLNGATGFPIMNIHSVPTSPPKEFEPNTRVRYLSASETIGTPTASLLSIGSNLSEIENELQILYFEQSSTLVKEGEKNSGLYFVIDGILDVYVKGEPADPLESSKLDLPSSTDVEAPQRKIYSIRPGGLAGYLAALTGHPSFVTIRAKTDAYIGFLSKSSMDRMCEKYPMVLLALGKRLVTEISPLVLHIDFALEWVQVNAGKVLFRQGDKISDCVYVVLNGRLRSIEERKSTEPEVVHEFGQGESVGELEVLTKTARPATVHAIRDTELARLPKTLFNALALRHPEITIQISRLIASRSRDLLQRNHASSGSNMNLKTVALLPVADGVPVLEFADKLRESLLNIGASSMILDSTSVTYALGKHAFSRLAKLKIMSWLTEHEESVRLVIYVADLGANNSWTQWCIRQADCILLLGLEEQSKDIGDIERLMLNLKTTARKELVILHPSRHIEKGTTRQWLEPRPWIQAHHHVQLPLLRAPHNMSTTKHGNPFSDLKMQIEKITKFNAFLKVKKEGSTKSSGIRSDFARLARRLTGKTIGLALGGGGARGIAHIGVIQAFEEAEIPIDIVGGVSIGALIGGLYSHHEDIWFTYWRAKEFAQRVVSTWRQLLDLTYPLTSWFTGHEFNRSIWKCYGESQIEDSWLSYFCVTTNITHSRMEIHARGYKWRYVRASMSLSGFLPPLCDDGNMLLDGGYLNNLPADIVRSLGADTVIAVDVGSEDDTSPASYGDYLSGWYALFCSVWPFGKKMRIPTLADIQSRLAYVSCVKQLEDVKAMENCFYLRPPVAHYGTLEFKRFEEIYEAGYRYGQEVIREWRLKGLLCQPIAVKKKKRIRRRNSV